MTHTDFIILNMMKHQLLDIYQTYHDMPHLLADSTIKEAYQSLLSVRTSWEFNKWRKLISVLGLSFTDTDSVKRRDNMIGWLDDLADGENETTISDFIRWKNSFPASDWYEKIVENENVINKVLAEVSRDYDVHLVLFRCGRHWAAIGNDADRLFEIFGWQTGSVFDGEKDVSFMYVTDCGKIAIDASDYSVKYLDLGDIDIFSSSFNEDIVSAYQQQIDSVRITCAQIPKVEGLMGYNLSFTVPYSGYKELVKADVSFRDIDGESLYKIVAKLEDGREVVLADGRSWRLDALGLPLIQELGKATRKAKK